VNLPGKIEFFFTRIHELPDFTPDWRRWCYITHFLAYGNDYQPEVVFQTKMAPDVN